ncbi:hypothetical protein AAFF_G00028280 [Aldrovandia affinis]|uniref:HAT C-terminal dimerisation domain-containing protein n=1 Tax=Aldrovandia affinis TaxID=143900 RepID=A0AAD7S6N4_9TELE|nr:hypothetical protein AAFF_G00028280 [Aldrovandia affinis]
MPCLNDLRRLQCLVDMLVPLADLTDQIQTELGNLGIVLPAVAEIKTLLTSRTQPIGIAAFAETLAANVSTRYTPYYSDKHLVLVAVLHPRFKSQWIIRDEMVQYKLGEIRNLLVQETEAVSAEAHMPEADTENGECDVPKRARMFRSYVTQTHFKDANSEIEEYLSTERKRPDQDVIRFRERNCSTLLRLAKVARKVFSVPGGSTSAETVFSVARLLARHHRMSLKPQTLFQK